MPYTLVNLNQTPEQRKSKYLIAKTLGKNVAWARTMRDWRMTTISYYFGFKDPKAMLEALEQCPQPVLLSNKPPLSSPQRHYKAHLEPCRDASYRRDSLEALKTEQRRGLQTRLKGDLTSWHVLDAEYDVKLQGAQPLLVLQPGQRDTGREPV